jgi:hypothetical protein
MTEIDPSCIIKEDEHFKKCLSIIDDWAEKNKPPTLYEIIQDKLGYSPDSAQQIVDAVSRWLPKENSRFSYDTMQWDKCVKMMRDKLQ